MEGSINEVRTRLLAMNVRQLDEVKREFASRLPRPLNEYRSRADMIADLATLIASASLAPEESVESNLPALFQDYLKKKDKLNAIRLNLMEMFKNKFFANQKEFAQALDFLGKLEAQFKDNTCRIMVIGNNSSGKSLFLNLIMGAEVLPYTTLPCTSVICEIEKSDKKWFRVKDYNDQIVVDRSLEDPNQKPKDILAPYIFAQGTDRNTQGKYKVVQISWPAQILGDGIVLVDSPGLEENSAMTRVVEGYIKTATALVCIVDGTQGAITESLRNTLTKVSLDLATKDENDLQTGIHREAVFFVCNKWDLLTEERSREEVFQNIVNHAKMFWSPDVTENQFIKMNTFAAFKARVEQNRDNEGAKALKTALNQFLEKAFFFKLHNLWYNINFICMRGARVGRTQWNLVNKTDSDRTKIKKDAKVRLEKLYHHLRDEQAQQRLLSDYQKYFNEAVKKLDEFLKSPAVEELVSKWANSIKIDMNDYPTKFDQEFMKFIEQLVDHWEAKNKHFKNAEVNSMKQLADAVHMAEKEREIVERLLAGEPQQSVANNASSMSSGTKILIGVTAPIWIPLAIVAVPVILVVAAVSFFKEKSKQNEFEAFQKKRQEAYLKDPMRQKADDSKLLIKAISAQSLTAKKFTSTEAFMKKVFNDLSLRIMFDIKQIEEFEADEKNLQLLKEVLESVMKITEAVVGATRDYYIENLRKDSTDKRKVVLGRQIGSGAFSKVYEGTYNGAPVAVKVLITGDLATINAFFQEEEVLVALKHKSILQFYGTYIEPRPTGDKEFYIVTALADSNLRKYLETSKVRVERLQMIKDLASAIEYMHQNDYVHRDLKPENILIQRGQVKVADVGLTRKSFDITGTLAGTPLYMAPEILRYEYDEKVDVFSFGRIIWEIWFLQSCERYFPRNADIVTVISKSFDLPLSLPGREEPPVALAELFVKCCKHNKDERPNFEKINEILAGIS